MKMLKKVLIVLLILIMLSMVLVGCESKDIGDIPPEEGQEQKSPTSGGTSSGDEFSSGCQMHTFDEWAIVKEATCTGVGEEMRSCTVCQFTEIKIVGKLAHTCTEWTYTTQPTCTQKGYKTSVCTICRTAIGGYEVASGHNFNGEICIDCEFVRPAASEGLEFELLSDGSGYKVVGMGTCRDEDLVIPSEYNGLPVAEIAYAAFEYSSYYRNHNLKSVYIPGSIKMIGQSAFADSEKIESVIIENGVTRIGPYAFSRCQFASINLPQTLESIDQYAFSNTAFSEIVIPKKVTYYGCRIFQKIKGLKMIYVDPENAKYHSDGNCIIETSKHKLLEGCNESTIPSDGSVLEIYDRAFYKCVELTEICIPDTVLRVGCEAFLDCENLVRVTGMKNTTFIDSYAFSGCIHLEEITFSDRLIHIGHKLFFNCKSLTSLNIPQNLAIIGTNGSYSSKYEPFPLSSDTIFSNEIGAPNLTSITVVSGNKVYHDTGNCLIETATKTIIAAWKTSVIPTDGSVTIIGKEAFSGIDISSIRIPQPVTEIGNYAFLGCVKLAEVNFPTGIINVGRDILLKTKYYENDDNWDFGNAPSNGRALYIGEYLLAYDCEDVTKLTIKEGTVLIANSAFQNKESCVEVVLPDSLKYICGRGFSGFCSLIEIAIPEGIAELGYWMFMNCSDLIRITIPSSIKYISSNAFDYCQNISEIHYKGTKEEWEKIDKDSKWDRNIESCTVYCTDGTIGVGKNAQK